MPTFREQGPEAAFEQSKNLSKSIGNPSHGYFLAAIAVAVIITCFLSLRVRDDLGNVHAQEAGKGDSPRAKPAEDPQDALLDSKKFPIPTALPGRLADFFKRSVICDDFVMDGEAKGQIEIEQELTAAYMKEHVRQRFMKQREYGGLKKRSETALGTESSSARFTELVEYQAMLEWGVPKQDYRMELLRRATEGYIDEMLAAWRKSGKKSDLLRGKSKADEECLLVAQAIMIEEIHAAEAKAILENRESTPEAKRKAKAEHDRLLARVSTFLRVLSEFREPDSVANTGWGGDFCDRATVLMGLLSAHRMGAKLDSDLLDHVARIMVDTYRGYLAFKPSANDPRKHFEIRWRMPAKKPGGPSEGTKILHVIPVAWSGNNARVHRAKANNGPGAYGTMANLTSAIVCRHLLKENGRKPLGKIDEEEWRTAVWSGLAFVREDMQLCETEYKEAGYLYPYLTNLWDSAWPFAALTGNQFFLDLEWYPWAVLGSLSHWHATAYASLVEQEKPQQDEGKDRSHPGRIAVIRAFINSEYFKSPIRGPQSDCIRAVLMFQGLAAVPVPLPAKGEKEQEKAGNDAKKGDDGGQKE